MCCQPISTHIWPVRQILATEGTGELWCWLLCVLTSPLNFVLWCLSFSASNKTIIVMNQIQCSSEYEIIFTAWEGLEQPLFPSAIKFCQCPSYKEQPNFNWTAWGEVSCGSSDVLLRGRYGKSTLASQKCWAGGKQEVVPGPSCPLSGRSRCVGPPCTRCPGASTRRRPACSARGWPGEPFKIRPGWQGQHPPNPTKRGKGGGAVGVQPKRIVVGGLQWQGRGSGTIFEETPRKGNPLNYLPKCVKIPQKNTIPKTLSPFRKKFILRENIFFSQIKLHTFAPKRTEKVLHMLGNFFSLFSLCNIIHLRLFWNNYSQLSLFFL